MGVKGLSALQQNRALSRLLYLFYSKESMKFSMHCFQFSKKLKVINYDWSLIGALFFLVFGTKFIFHLILPTPVCFTVPLLSQFLFCFGGDHINPF